MGEGFQQTLIKLLVYVETLAVFAWFGLSCVTHFFASLRSIGKAGEDPAEKAYLIREIALFIIDIIILLISALVALYVHAHF